MTQLDKHMLEADLCQTWKDLGLATPVVDAQSATLVATPALADESSLPSLLTGATHTGARLVLGAVLGEGGMGLVRSATQTELGRQVAVKSVRPDIATADHALQLLREGRVTGLLEHPNIVPVHALGKDATGSPLIVMKRIEGTPWTEQLRNESAETRRSEAFLRQHLRVLEQVALALHFAHSHGILHRDVKPDNVMIGAFREVYLLDWGIAVSDSDEGLAGVPHTRDVRAIEGTPAYMAPEMVEGDGRHLGIWSDVYLLGATLHHVLTGTPPHDAPTGHGALLRAFASTPTDYDASMPSELVAIVHRAMDRVPGARFEDAAGFAEALDHFLVHRGSVELCVEAEHRAAELTDIAARIVDDDHDRRVDDDPDALFHEAHFAFEQALRSWPANPRALRGVRDLTATMVRVELSRGAPAVASALLRRHSDPPAELVEIVKQAMAEQHSRGARLASLEQDIDPAFGATERLKMSYLGGGSWMLICVVAGALTRYDILPIEHRHMPVIAIVLLLGTSLTLREYRDVILTSAANRSVAFVSLLVFSCGIVLWPVLGLVGVTMPMSTVVGTLVVALLWATVLPYFGKPWLPMPIGHVFVAIGAWFWPAYHFELYGLTALPVVLTAWLMKTAADRADELLRRQVD